MKILHIDFSYVVEVHTKIQYHKAQTSVVKKSLWQVFKVDAAPTKLIQLLLNENFVDNLVDTMCWHLKVQVLHFCELNYKK